MTELALPAGSLSGALTAFNNGADAVYFGLREFSARKGAVNFSLEDLSKIRRYSLEKGKKIYVTVNTLIDDSSVERVIPLLDALSYYGNDGIIIQDLGLVEIIKRYYPDLKMHGSTQLAVHTIDGVKKMRDLGFERVVLSRELTFSEIEKIRRECRDIELKVFIHGALCYGFSGLCSASFLKCGRSANKGECAQICRSWFIDEESGKKGYYFSMEDLALREEVSALERIGIDSLKVEGRLKSPEYTAACARYYRAILDGKRPDKEEEDALYTTFLRKSGDGYFNYKKNRESLVSVSYPGHLGLPLGKIVEERNTDCFLETKGRLENHDGIQYFVKEDSSLLSPIKLSAAVKGRTPGGYILRKEGKQCLLGKEIYKISDSTKREKLPNENIPPFRKPIDMKVTLLPDRIVGEANNKTITFEVNTVESESGKDIALLIERTLSESGNSPYTLKRLTFVNNTSLSHPFVQPSLIKEFRRRLYSSLGEIEFISPVIEEPQKVEGSFLLPDRTLLEGDLPWSKDGKRIDGRTYFTFPPVTFDEEKEFREMEEAVKGEENVTIGLNNISQLSFASRHPEYTYFADIYLYLSSRFALSLLIKECPSIKAGYLWFEKSSFSGKWPFEPTITHYNAPMFISRSCYRHDSLGLSCDGCRRRDEYHLSQNGEKYTVLVRNCLTVMKREGK